MGHAVMGNNSRLKSVLVKARYGFESHHRHPLITRLSQGESLGFAILSVANGYASKRIKDRLFVKSPGSNRGFESHPFRRILFLIEKLANTSFIRSRTGTSHIREQRKSHHQVAAVDVEGRAGDVAEMGQLGVCKNLSKSNDTFARPVRLAPGRRFVDRATRHTKTHENTIYLSSIR